MYDTVLFDLDGTLTDSLPLIRQTYLQVFREMDIPWGEDDVMKLIGLPLREIGRKMAGEEKKDDFFALYQKYYKIAHHQFMRCFPGIPDVLERLSSLGYTLGVVTSKSRQGTELTLDFLKIKHYFTVVITADDTEKHKPAPDPVLAALGALQTNPQNAVFVGDSPFDIVSGNQAGVFTIAVTWGMAEKEELGRHQPNLIIGRQQELVTFLLANRAES